MEGAEGSEVPKTKVLVVDDERSICALLEKFLKMKQYETLSAFDGAEALEKIREHAPRFVLLDYRMPKMNGLQVLGEIRKLYPDTVVMMMTGVDEEWIWERARSMGVDGFLMKPIDFKYLETLLVTKLI